MSSTTDHPQTDEGTTTTTTTTVTTAIATTAVSDSTSTNTTHHPTSIMGTNLNNNNNNNSDTTDHLVVDTAVVIVDDPCWGTPISCDLQDLLHCLDHAQQQQHQHQPSLLPQQHQNHPHHHPTHPHLVNNMKYNILYESNDYIVLNKPPDLRMDGDFPATVTKLLLYYYPPVSLFLSPEPLSVLSLSTTSNPTEKDVANATTSITVTNTDSDVTDTDALIHVYPRIKRMIKIWNDDMNQTNPNKIPAVLLSSITSATATPSSLQFTKEQIQLLYCSGYPPYHNFVTFGTMNYVPVIHWIMQHWGCC
jgi:hypothetical protein